MDTFSIPPPMPRAAEEEERSISETMEDSEPTEVKLLRATEAKDKGNALFGKEDIAGARDAYEEGLDILSKVYSADDLKMALWGNASLMSLKLEDYDACIRYSDQVLAKNPENYKILYRRVHAYMKTKHFDEAKADLITLIRKEPSCKEYRQLYEEAVEKAKAMEAERKQAYSGIFKKSLYADREREMRSRIVQEKKKEELLRKEWEDEMARRAENGEDQQEFEDWAKIQTAAKGISQESAPPRDENKEVKPVGQRSSAKKEESEEEYTEAEAKLLAELKGKGYCYFRDRVLTEEEKAAKTKINQNVPQVVAERQDIPQPASDKALSSWNSKGTSYEEKNVTKWAEEVLRNLWQSSSDTLPNGSELSISSISLEGGQAQIAVISGSKRYIYDLEYKITLNIKKKDKNTSITVLINPSNVSDKNHSWIDEASFSSSIKTCGEEADDVKNLVKRILRLCIEQFEETFKQL